MKQKIENLIKKFPLSLFGLILLQPLIITAQSDHVNPTICLQSAEKASDENKVEAGKLPQYQYLFSENVPSFIEKLNELGKCGYRLDKLTKFPLEVNKKFNDLKLAGVVKLDVQNKYEYDWFEAFTPGELTTRLNYRAKKGFRLRDSIPSVLEACGRPSTRSASSDEIDKMIDAVADLLYTTFGKVFFLERKNNDSAELGDSRVIIGRVGWGKSPTMELQQSLEKTVKYGFSPVDMGFGKIGNRYAVFLVMTNNGSLPDSAVKNNPVYKVVKSEYGFEKKVNLLAKQGFKIQFYDTYGAYGFVTMIKENQVSSPVSYQWVNVLEKNWQNKILKLSQQGAVYKTLGTTATTLYCDDFEGKLVFETPLVDNGKKYEYKLLKMSDRTSYAGNKQLPRPLMPSAEALENFDKLLKEGFIIRDLFYAEGIHVLFERVK